MFHTFVFNNFGRFWDTFWINFGSHGATFVHRFGTLFQDLFGEAKIEQKDLTYKPVLAWEREARIS